MNDIMSISEQTGLNFLRESDKRIYSVGISTGGNAEIAMAKKDLTAKSIHFLRF